MEMLISASEEAFLHVGSMIGFLFCYLDILIIKLVEILLISYQKQKISTINRCFNWSYTRLWRKFGNNAIVYKWKIKLWSNNCKFNS